MSENQIPEERIHVIRAQVSYGTVALVTKRTTEPAEVFETDALRQYPGATLKPTRSYHPAVFSYLEGEAEESGLTIDEVIDMAEAKRAARGTPQEGKGEQHE